MIPLVGLGKEKAEKADTGYRCLFSSDFIIHFYKEMLKFLF